MDVDYLTLQITGPKHALHRKTCGYGPGPFFGGLLVERGISRTVGLVPCAVGGTEIDEWREGSLLFNQMVGLALSNTGKGA